MWNSISLKSNSVSLIGIQCHLGKFNFNKETKVAISDKFILLVGDIFLQAHMIG